MLTDAIAEVLRAHHPNPPATQGEISEFEQRQGIRLDADLRSFYAACNGASLFRVEDSPYEIVRLDEIVPGEVAIFGTDRRFGPPPPCPTNVFAFCYVQDGNHVAFETGPQPYPMLDLFHETWPKYRDLIAPSFADFLHQALRSEGRHYWLVQR